MIIIIFSLPLLSEISIEKNGIEDVFLAILLAQRKKTFSFEPFFFEISDKTLKF